MLTIYSKYDNILKTLNLTGKPELIENYKTLGWLLFILARRQILLQHSRNEIVESACLLIVVLLFMLVNMPKTINFD